jgi:hypothetical protein
MTDGENDEIWKAAAVDQVTIRARILVDERYSKTNPLKVGEIISAIKRSPPVELDGNRVIIETLTKHTHKRYVSISYEILVPREAEINVHSVSGNVRVSGIIGEVNATSDTGKVTVAKLDEANAARSSSWTNRAFRALVKPSIWQCSRKKRILWTRFHSRAIAMAKSPQIPGHLSCTYMAPPSKYA